MAHSLIFSQKTSDSLRKPMSKFQALKINAILSETKLKQRKSSEVKLGQSNDNDT